MSDLFQLSNLEAADFNSGTGPGDPSQLKTGDLRRKYNFGDRVSELAIPQDPFFRFVSKVGKKPTDDPQFKFTEKRDSWHKRYAYPTAFSNDGATYVEDQSTNATTQYDTYETAGNTVYVKMACDYKTSGNIQSAYGNTNSDVLPEGKKVGDIKTEAFTTAGNLGKAINTSGIVAHLTKAVQELSAKVTALENA